MVAIKDSQILMSVPYVTWYQYQHHIIYAAASKKVLLAPVDWCPPKTGVLSDAQIRSWHIVPVPAPHAAASKKVPGH